MSSEACQPLRTAQPIAMDCPPQQPWGQQPWEQFCLAGEVAGVTPTSPVQIVALVPVNMYVASLSSVTGATMWYECLANIAYPYHFETALPAGGHCPAPGIWQMGAQQQGGSAGMASQNYSQTVVSTENSSAGEHSQACVVPHQQQCQTAARQQGSIAGMGEQGSITCMERHLWWRAKLQQKQHRRGSAASQLKDEDAAFVAALAAELMTQLQAGKKSRQEALRRMRKLSSERLGCRAVQRILESADEDLVVLMAEAVLRGRVVKAAYCRHTNYVLQKVIEVLKDLDQAHFIIDEIFVEGSKLASHKYGIRSYQRLLEKFGKHQRVEALIERSVFGDKKLIEHPIGAHVFEWVWMHGSDEQRTIIRALLQNDLLRRARRCSAYVWETALLHSRAGDHPALASPLLEAPDDQFAGLMRSFFGSMVVRAMLCVSNPHVRKTCHEKVQRQLKNPAVLLDLKNTEHGEWLLSLTMPEEMEEEAQGGGEEDEEEEDEEEV
mmetsp:Transcript_59354/g.150353  ORF Transcript_59354/g.150353 Transcript_59354/m.150353 type:complete len:495 (+) Transcript_59354:68-1552(+)